MNKVLLTGKLTKDVDARTARSGKTYASLSLSTEDGQDEDGNKRYKYVTVKVFNRLAEVCGKFGDKGKLVSIEGRVGDTKYEKNGVTVYSTDVIADKVEFLTWVKEEAKPVEEKPVSNEQMDFEQIEEDVPF